MSVEPPIDLAGLTSDEFVALAAKRSIRRERAIATYRSAFREVAKGATSATVSRHPVVRTWRDGVTTKFVLMHEDGLETESVILPITGSTGRTRNTLCVSSQIGCAMGCHFCETGQMGLMKNLTAAQIVSQWFAARADFDSVIDNIVFMGMGEPMHNLEAVIQAIRVFCDRDGAAIAPARISVSTVGIADGILRLAEIVRQPGLRKLRLAVSINAPNDEIRSRIMPINRATPLADLMKAMLRWPTERTGGAPRQRVFIEYVLIPGVNDAPNHADELCEYLRPLHCTVNVIPYNPRRESPWEAPREEIVRAFIGRIHDRGQFVKRRQTMGREAMAACGQLGNPLMRRRVPLRLQQATP
jgi:23S rRNA (adenine2503-C2)-methyltransferase